VQKLLYAAGTAFLRAFAVTFLFAATGLLAAPNLSAAVALSWAALVAALVAGLRTLQVFVPGLTTKAIFGTVWGAYADSFLRAFLASFLTLLTGWLAAPDWSTWKSAILAVLVGAVTAGVRALQGLVTPGETPAAGSGVSVPADTPAA
jgi:hypothetical protein